MLKAKNKNKYKRGSVGTATIQQKIPGTKRVTCSKCFHYCKEDRSCVKKGIYVPDFNYNYWKICDEFDLDKEFDNDENRKYVERNSVLINKEKLEKESKKIINKELSKKIEDRKHYKSLMKKIGNRTKIEHLFLKYFKGEISPIELYDKAEEILKGKNISNKEVNFIREYLRKEYEETNIL